MPGSGQRLRSGRGGLLRASFNLESGVQRGGVSCSAPRAPRSLERRRLPCSVTGPFKSRRSALDPPPRHAPKKRVGREPAVRGAGWAKSAAAPGHLRGTVRRGRYGPVPGRWAEERAVGTWGPGDLAYPPVPNPGSRRCAPGDAAGRERPAAILQREPQPSAARKTAAPRSPQVSHLLSVSLV